MMRPTEFDLSFVPTEELEAMREAGECHRVLAKTNDKIVSEFLKAQRAAAKGKFRLEEGIRDLQSHSQYCFHTRQQVRRRCGLPVPASVRDRPRAAVLSGKRLDHEHARSVPATDQTAHA
jgi:hypothetical protein